MRFGLGTLPTASTLFQDGDQVFVLATDPMVRPITKITGSAPEGGH
jgi:trk system potassium uptake protein TrkA